GGGGYRRPSVEEAQLGADEEGDAMTGETMQLPESFPRSDYTPFGYIDNPYHSGVLNPSGILRTVPPMGMGFWARAMPWAYGGGVERRLSYLSFLYLSLAIDGHVFHSVEDFQREGVLLASKYH